MIDCLNINAFYKTENGRIVKHDITECIKNMPEQKNPNTVVGLGYPIPYLNIWKQNNPIALMQAKQGAIRWPVKNPSKTGLVSETNLPLETNSVDLFILIHALEFISNQNEMLKEIWRKLHPAGELIIVVPNRIGLWARNETTPFGHGTPFSKRQINIMLIKAGFIVTKQKTTLAKIPIQNNQNDYSMIQKILYIPAEKIIYQTLAPFGGVIVTKAKKQIFQPIKYRNIKQPKLVGVKAA